MKEKIIPAEVLQQRSDAIISGMQRMLADGFSPDWLNDLEQYHPRKHRDVFLVYLGLKPCATHLPAVFDYYDMSKNFFNHFPQVTDTGITVLVHSDSCSVWNPDLVTEVLEENKDLKAGVPVNPFNYNDFGAFLDSLYDTNSKQIILHGIILGYPRRAVEMFEQYYGEAVTIAPQLWRKAQIQGVTPEAPSPEVILFDLHDPGGLHEPAIRNEFVRLARLTGYHNVGVVNYIQGLRPADTPGWQFFTTGDITREEERSAREQYAASKFEEKYTKFLGEFNLPQSI